MLVSSLKKVAVYVTPVLRWDTVSSVSFLPSGRLIVGGKTPRQVSQPVPCAKQHRLSYLTVRTSSQPPHLGAFPRQLGQQPSPHETFPFFKQNLQSGLPAQSRDEPGNPYRSCRCRGGPERALEGGLHFAPEGPKSFPRGDAACTDA